MLFSNKLIHYTDYHFQRFCFENFGINRGVYNTIENWFYNKGLDDITRRRKEILAFLEFTAVDFYQTNRTKVKFGGGMLVKKLDEYWQESHLNHHHVYSH